MTVHVPRIFAIAAFPIAPAGAIVRRDH